MDESFLYNAAYNIGSCTSSIPCDMEADDNDDDDDNDDNDDNESQLNDEQWLQRHLGIVSIDSDHDLYYDHDQMDSDDHRRDYDLINVRPDDDNDATTIIIKRIKGWLWTISRLWIWTRLWSPWSTLDGDLHADPILQEQINESSICREQNPTFIIF